MHGIEFKVVSEEYCDSEEISKLRTSVSRSFYAFFHHIKDIWRSLKWENKTLIDEMNHEKLKRVLNNTDEYSNIYPNFMLLRENRVKADYKLYQIIDKKISDEKIAEEMLKVLDALIEEFDECDHNKAQEQIIAYLRPQGEIIS